MTIIEDAKEIIEASGNNFHSQVINHLKERKWHTLVSPYYTDNVTNKPREIDLVAEKAFEYNDDFERVNGTINVKLYIECKFIPQINVFWFADKDLISADNLVIDTTLHERGNIYRKDHHYLKDQERVAKLFSAKNNRNVENEAIYKALNQSLNAMVYHRISGSILPELADENRPRRRQSILATLEYPLIICNSFEKFLRTDVDSTEDPVLIENNFQLEVNYAYMDTNKNQISEFFLIDVLDFNKLDDYLDIVNSDVDSIKHVIGN